jgi:hypothetical protein
MRQVSISALRPEQLAEEMTMCRGALPWDLAADSTSRQAMAKHRDVLSPSQLST